MSVTKQLRGRHATAVRMGRTDEAKRLRCDMTAAVLEDRIADALASNDLTTDQRQRLAGLLAVAIPAALPTTGPTAHAPERTDGRDPHPGHPTTQL